MSETWVQSLGWEDHLEKRMAIHSSFLAYRIPWTEEPDRLQSMGPQRVGQDWATSQTGSKKEKEYVKAAYCHPTYLTYMKSTSWETLD